ncbi:interleukin 17a/f2 [Halichoeres trimaculatus]|uniref:interleukin 17a/f2 n=1 Tax=Halichoeres trimaculatus TaxID=147232 RepID=UPI003D9F59E6
MGLNCSLMTVCCCALWIVSCSSSGVEAPPPSLSSPLPPICDSRLAFSSEITSWSDRNGDTNVRSLSPWTWRSSTEKNRILSTIFEAECSSSFCDPPNKEQTDRHSLNSVPIYQNILVLQRLGRRCYKAMYQRVAVGCTCVWAQSKEQETS